MEMKLLRPCPTHQLVEFKLKSKYFKNEDIKVQYILKPKVHQLPRDWIGLYPRGWNNLQQYITFEWANRPPCEHHLKLRTEIFKHTYHSEAVTTDRDYQFVYVNKTMKVLGCSAYFGFLPSMPFSAVLKSDISMLASQQDGLTRAPNVYKLLKPTIPTLQLKAGPAVLNHAPEKPQRKFQKSSMQHKSCATTAQVSQTDVNLSNADLPGPKQDGAPEASCQPNKEEESVNENDNEEVKNTAQDIEYLQNRIEEMEALLEKSRLSQKIYKMSAHRSKWEKLAYQNFVSDLLDNLSKKCIVRVIDEQGSEMLVKCVQDVQDEALADKPVTTRRPAPVKETSKERQLKAAIGFQEQTIQRLQLRLALSKDKESSEGNTEGEEDQLAFCKTNPLFTTVIHENTESDTADMATDDISNVNDIIVSNIEDSEPQVPLHNKEVMSSKEEKCVIQETIPTSVENEPKECSEEAGAIYKSKEGSSIVDTGISIEIESAPVSSEAEKLGVVTCAASPTVAINSGSVTFSILK